MEITLFGKGAAGILCENWDCLSWQCLPKRTETSLARRLLASRHSSSRVRSPGQASMSENGRVARTLSVALRADFA